MDNSGNTETAGPSVKLFPSPIKKNKRGKIISSSERLRIINMYKANLEEDPNMSMRSMRQIISKNMGISESTVHRTINVYKETSTVTSPKRKRVRENVFHLYDDFSRNAVRRHVHNIWFRREIPTIDKIHKEVSDDKSLPAISRTSLFKLIKDLDFRYCKRSRNSALTEKNEIVVWRRRHLRAIREYREQGRHIYYLDETWVNAGECLIVLHIGSEDGFVPGGLLCFESKKNSRDYHDEMNGQTFYDWMENILPQLRDNCVIVMDNAPYHSVKKDKSPTSSTRKADIIKWLEDKGEVVDYTMVIPELLEIVKRIKPLHNKYVIDELAKASNKTILRLPPYHCELNPIELAWSSIKNHVKMNNSTFKLPDVKNLLLEGIERVDQVMWKNFIQHTKNRKKILGNRQYCRRSVGSGNIKFDIDNYR
ncbi:PREDICTED: uncharacterized protein LOC107162689 [Diuraphis noxia]|uniref:uncharacterized protein LOC107162689 n=1 Tax=Diuraphis noxia TaxID=143948 RepID=UPI0007635F57|nr:PREDICTED: uncharacterized protein LOC107162689 [Diuraphis noxia]